MSARAAGSAERPARDRAGEPAMLSAVGITKAFGSLKANDGVNFAILPGEIHALLGENGAGKSTLVKILYGSLQPNAGEIRWNGKAIEIASPAAARRIGIGMVFQHFSLFDALSVAENIALALDHRRSMADLRALIRETSVEYGLPLNPTASVADLSVGERQRVEIVRCLLQEPRLIIMDEPTSVLTPQEADDLFRTLRRLASEGCAILYISHRLEEVRALCHHATILRHGRVVAELDPTRETVGRLAALMVGAEIREVKAHDPVPPSSPVRLAVNDLSLPAPTPFAVALQHVSVEARGGEIVAIAGVAGNGQAELFEALSGERPASAGSILIDGAPVGDLGVTARRGRGAAFVPEERLGHGAVPGFTLTDNVVLTRHGTGDGVVRSGVVSRGRAAEIRARVMASFDVRSGSADPSAASLSGGNLQKFVVGREIDRRPGVLVVSQPTWGVDAGASAAIRQALIDLAGSGSAVVVISQDLDEILEISDWVAVIHRGHLSAMHRTTAISREAIGLLMGGASDDTIPGKREAALAH